MQDALIYNSDDTICAISTAPGTGGIAVARVSGHNAITIVSKIWKGKNLNDVASHSAHLGIVYDSNGEILDEAVATVFRNPNSFTGEDVVELSIHGSRWIQSQLIQSLITAGCRMALPGEITRRAFAAGRLDLAQAEAVADVISSSSKAAHRMAMSQMRGAFSKKIDAMRDELVQLASLLELELDFSEEDVEFASRNRLLEIADTLSAQLKRAAASFRAGQAIKDGIPVAIVGNTNAGKSSLLNALVEDDRAIVSDIHGTTRDVVEDTIEIGEYLIRFQDTAGLRQTEDPIEQLGIERSHSVASAANIVIYVVDSSIASNPEETARELPHIDIIVANKTDLPQQFDSATWQKVYPTATILPCSARNGKGIDTLRQTICDLLRADTSEDDIIVANARHAQSLAEAAANLEALSAALRNGIPTDLAAQDLRAAIHHLSTITGTITTPEILQNIFKNFCIGK